jgi:hypothetical protein
MQIVQKIKLQLALVDVVLVTRTAFDRPPH